MLHGVEYNSVNKREEPKKIILRLQIFLHGDISELFQPRQLSIKLLALKAIDRLWDIRKTDNKNNKKCELLLN